MGEHHVLWLLVFEAIPLMEKCPLNKAFWVFFLGRSWNHIFSWVMIRQEREPLQLRDELWGESAVGDAAPCIPDSLWEASATRLQRIQVWFRPLGFPSVPLDWGVGSETQTAPASQCGGQTRSRRGRIDLVPFNINRKIVMLLLNLCVKSNFYRRRHRKI